MRLSATIPTLALTVAFSAGLTTAASAMTTVSIPGLFNTGVNGSNVTLGNNAVDSHWRLTAAPIGVTLGNTYTGASNGSFPLNGAWAANNATSRWITPTVSHIQATPGLYTYEMQFTLTPKMITNTGQLTGRFMNDNALTSIFLNTTQLTAPAGNFKTFSNFSAASGFIAGLNKLSFTVRNDAGTSGNPTGLRVEFLSNSIGVVPEPGTWAMLIVGFGLIGVSMRRRQKFVAA